MSDLAENLRTFLLAQPGVAAIISDRIHQDHVPQKQLRPYIWFRQAAVEDDPCLDDAVGAQPFKVFYDLECCALDNDVAKSLAAAVRSTLHNYDGAFGDRSVMGAFVNEHDDDYVPRNANGDQGINVATFYLELIPRW